MNKLVVALLGLGLLAGPAISPALASEHGDQTDRSASETEDASGNSTASVTFSGDHVRLAVENATVRDFALVAPNQTVLAEIALPGTDAQHRVENDRVRVETDQAEFRVRDAPAVPTLIRAEETAPVRVTVAEGVTVTENRTDDGVVFQLELADTVFLINADEAAMTGDEIAISGAARALVQSPDAQGNETAEEERNQTERSQSAGDEDRDREQRSRQAPRDPGPPQRERGVTSADYEIGSAAFQLDNDTLRDVSIHNTSLFTSVDVPGLTPATSRQQDERLRLNGEDARVDVRADEGVLLRVESDAGVQAELAPGIEVREAEEGLFLRSGSLLAVVQGDNVEVEDRQLFADGDLRLLVHGSEKAKGPIWDRERDPAGASETLPIAFEGRYIEFTLNETGVQNVSVHGTPLGDIPTSKVNVTEVQRAGSQIRIEGDGFEVKAVDAPAARLEVQAPGLVSQIDGPTTLPSGAQVQTHVGSTEFRLQVTRPADAMASTSPVEHRPADTPVTRSSGPNPGLQTRTAGGDLGITSSDPARLAAQFNGTLNGTEGNISVTLGLTRAMLVEDTNGNSRVDVGEPAIAERALADGTTRVIGDELVSTFELWSGNLTVRVEPGNTTAKVTYEAHDLQAPPGTLFVLETQVQAPEDAKLRPTEDGVQVRNGSMRASYSAAGPVTVDGEEAWAQRSIFVDSNDTVRMLVAYPAGDDVVHDPTLSVQSIPGQQAVARLAASPYAIVIGVLAAGALVAGTAYHKRQQRP